MLKENVNIIDVEIFNIDDINLECWDSEDEELVQPLEQVIRDNWDKFFIGEKLEGNIEIINEQIRFEYRYCTEVGEDWSDDEWEEEQILILPNV